MNLKTQWPLVLAFLLPVALVAVLVGIIFLPRLWLKPQQSFLYSVDKNYSSDIMYRVYDGKLTREAVGHLDNGSGGAPYTLPPALFIYNPIDKTSRPVSETEAMQLRLNAQSRSRDGFRVSTDYSGGDFLFGRSDMQVVMSSAKGSLVIYPDGLYPSSYSGSFSFIGWIE